MRVAIQPCGDSTARQHYIDTIQNLITPERIRPFLSPDQLDSFNSCFDGPVAVWGVTNGQGNINRRKWEKLQAGDVALLYRDKRIFSYGRIAMTLCNAPLARHLWSSLADGSTWENMYFFAELQEIEIPVARYNKVLGYKPQNIVQGFNVYEGDKAKVLLGLLEVEDTEEIEISTPADPAELQKRLTELQGLDLPSASTARKEGGIFRKYLFSTNKSAPCHICGRQLPVDLLVAAHIKRRSSASDEERRNLRIVMSACRLGCDELFEKNYIQVGVSGAIEINDHMSSVTGDLKNFAQSLLGRTCTAFDEATADFFKWHRDHPRRLLTKAK
jgi:hypothetical protein